MITLVSQISNNLTTVTGANLGAGYSELDYVVDTEKNKFIGNNKRYGILPLAASETEGQTCAYTMDHTFVCKLTDGYNLGGKAQLNDRQKALRVVELQNKALELYRIYAVNKSQMSPAILIINNLEIGEVEFVEDSNVAILQFSFNIKYAVKQVYPTGTPRYVLAEDGTYILQENGSKIELE